jgi:hypothetical protein
MLEIETLEYVRYIYIHRYEYVSSEPEESKPWRGYETLTQGSCQFTDDAMIHRLNLERLNLERPNLERLNLEWTEPQMD